MGNELGERRAHQIPRTGPWCRTTAREARVGPYVSMNVGPVSNLQTTDVSSPIFANRRPQHDLRYRALLLRHLDRTPRGTHRAGERTRTSVHPSLTRFMHRGNKCGCTYMLLKMTELSN